jgi:DNA invertase Pin-like site-specific DNA recombinase
MANDPGRKLMRQIFGAIAEYEKDLIVSKLAHARASVRAKGGFSGGNIPYGYCPRRATEEQIVRANSERVTAQYIRQLRAQGLTLEAIGRTITAEGHQARGGRPWQLSSIRRIARGEG